MFILRKKIFLFPGMEQLHTCAKFHQPANTATEYDNIRYVCDSKLAADKMITKMSHTSDFLNATGKLK